MFIGPNPYQSLIQSLLKVIHIMKFGKNWVINDYVRMSTIANRQAAPILVAILVIIHQIKPREFDESNRYMKFGKKWVKNDYVSVSMITNQQVAAILETNILFQFIKQNTF